MRRYLKIMVRRAIKQREKLRRNHVQRRAYCRWSLHWSTAIFCQTPTWFRISHPPTNGSCCFVNLPDWRKICQRESSRSRSFHIRTVDHGIQPYRGSGDVSFPVWTRSQQRHGRRWRNTRRSLLIPRYLWANSWFLLICNFRDFLADEILPIKHRLSLSSYDERF